MIHILKLLITAAADDLFQDSFDPEASVILFPKTVDHRIIIIRFQFPQNTVSLRRPLLRSVECQIVGHYLFRVRLLIRDRVLHLSQGSPSPFCIDGKCGHSLLQLLLRHIFSCYPPEVRKCDIRNTVRAGKSAPVAGFSEDQIVVEADKEGVQEPVFGDGLPVRGFKKLPGEAV